VGGDMTARSPVQEAQVRVRNVQRSSISRLSARRSLLVSALVLLGSLFAAFGVDRAADNDCPAITMRYEPADGGALVVRACGVISLIALVAFRYDMQVRLTMIPFGATQIDIGSPISK
jgi:hypothetical protein